MFFCFLFCLLNSSSSTTRWLSPYSVYMVILSIYMSISYTTYALMVAGGLEQFPAATGRETVHTLGRLAACCTAGYVFTPSICLLVGLCVFMHDYRKTTKWITTKLGGLMWNVSIKNLLSVAEDPDQGVGFHFLSDCVIGRFSKFSLISQTIIHGS